MKAKRNNPCPCGSGKKYKKCCLSAALAALPRHVLPSGEPASDPPAEEPITPLGAGAPPADAAIADDPWGTRQGAYEPLTLAIYLNSAVQPVREDPASVPLSRDEATITFLHEHRHLIQEVSTFYGVLAFARYFQIIPAVRAATRDTRDVELPLFSHGAVGVEESRRWAEWRRVNEGGVFPPEIGSPPFNENLPYEITEYARVDEMELVAQEDQHRHRAFIQSVRVTIRQQHAANGVTQAHYYLANLGAYAICEGQAYLLCEALHEDDREIRRTVNAPPYPYRALELLAECVKATGNGQREVCGADLATFAERALMTPAPGSFFLGYLEAFVGDASRTPMDVCDMVEADVGWNFNDMLRSARRSLRQLAGSFAVSRRKGKFLRWFVRFVNDALEMRLRDRDFFLRPFLENAWAASEDMRRAVPVPLIIDKRHKLSSYEGAGQSKGAFDASRFFQALRYAIRVLTERADGTTDLSNRCPLYESCTEHIKKKSKACLQAPWMLADVQFKDVRGRGTCAIGSAFAALGLKRKRITPKPPDRDVRTPQVE